LKPHFLSDSLLDSLLNIALRYRERINPNVILPTVNWRQPKKEPLASEKEVGVGAALGSGRATF
jgi:UDP-sulfoquinovose synthase